MGSIHWILLGWCCSSNIYYIII